MHFKCHFKCHFLLIFENKSVKLQMEEENIKNSAMKKSIQKIFSGVVLVSFMGAIFCSLGFCPGMMKMANADEPSSMMQMEPRPDSNGQNNPCPPSSQSSKSQNCNCCKCLDTAALLKSDHKNQIHASTSDFFKAFTHLATFVSQLSFGSHFKPFDHSPPRIALNSTPIYILNRTLRL